jgi:hypothetical protein
MSQVCCDDQIYEAVCCLNVVVLHLTRTLMEALVSNLVQPVSSLVYSLGIRLNTKHEPGYALGQLLPLA